MNDKTAIEKAREALVSVSRIVDVLSLFDVGGATEGSIAYKVKEALAALDAEKPATWEPSASKIMRERLAEMNVKLLSDKYDKSDRKRISEIVKDLEKEIAELDAEEIATCEAYYEKKRAKDVNDFRMDELDGVMHSVDKWLTGDALKNNPATRAGDAREIALKAIEKEAARADRAEKAIQLALDYLRARGVSEERIGNDVFRGIDALETRYRKDINAAEAELAALDAEKPGEDVREVARIVHEECFVDISQTTSTPSRSLIWDVDTAAHVVKSFAASYHAEQCKACNDFCARAKEHCEDRESPIV